MQATCPLTSSLLLHYQCITYNRELLEPLWFIFQLNLAKQIFEMAELFTSNKEDYALYWTDVDYDNYGVRDDGKVVIVDAENILVVDKQQVRAG